MYQRILLQRVIVLMAIVTIVLLLFWLSIGRQATAQSPPHFEKGDVFAAVGEGEVNRFRSDGTFFETIPTGQHGRNAGMAFDAAGNLYVTNFDARTVSKLNTKGEFQNLFGSGYGGAPESIVFDATGNAYVRTATGDGDIRMFNAEGTPVDHFDVARERHGSDWIDLAADQCTMFYTSEGKRIMRYDVCSDTQLADFVSGLPGAQAFALRILPDGGVLVADSGAIRRLDTGGNIVPPIYDIPGEPPWRNLGLAPDGTPFWGGGWDSNFYRFDIATGEYQALIGSQPASGTASGDPDGSISYSPNPGFTGSDSFIYLVNTFIDPTTANDDILVMFRDTPKTIDLLRNDFDPQGAPLDVTIQTLPSHRTVVENLDETIAYTSSSGFTGSDSFTYQIDDGNDHTDTTIVNLSVQAVNVAYMSHYLAPRPQTGNIDYCGTPINLRITTLNSSGATGTVSFPGSSEPVHSFTIAQHETFQLYLDTSTAPPPGGGPDLGITHQYNTIENNGIKVTADTAVDVQITQDTSCWQSFLQSKGLTALGTNFYAGQMYGEEYFRVPDDPGGFITVIATEDNTQVTFEAPPGATWNWRGTSQQIITVTLDTGQTYAVSAGFNGLIPNDLTGAHVTASKPIAVNSGAFGVYIPTHAGDHGWDQLVPVERIGAEYVIIKGSSTTERVDVVATQDGTDISVNGTTVATNLPAGGRYQFTPGGGANTPTLIETTKPAYVYQSSGSSHGENGMSLIPPIRTEGIGRVRFRAADSSTIIRAVLSTAALNTLQLTDITGGGSITVPINIGGASPVPGRPDLSIVQVDVTTGHEFIMGADSFIQATLTSFSPELGGGGGFSALSGFNVEADLAITKTDSPDDPVPVENNLTYTVIVTNNGPVEATGVTLTDTLPSNVTFVSATNCTEADGIVTCNLGSLANGASDTVTILVIPTMTGTITNTASVMGNKPDPNLANNTTTENTTVTSIKAADLAITQTDSPDPVTVGNNLTYTLLVANNGLSEATGVTLTDTLPSNVTFVSATNCTEADGIVTCNLGSLANGASDTVTILVIPTMTGTITNTASVMGNKPDPNLANNTTTENTMVTVAGPHEKSPPRSKESGPPIPEPTTITLVGLGLAGLAAYARRRRRRKTNKEPSAE